MIREEKLTALVPDAQTAVLLTSWPVVRYYMGCDAGEGNALLVWQGGYRLLTPAAKPADMTLPACVATLQTEPDALTARQALLLQKHLSQHIDLSDALADRIYAQRVHKAADEIEKIRQAQGITDRAFWELLNFIHVGMTDYEVQKTVADLLWKEGSQMTSFNHVVGCGDATANPHVRPDGHVVHRGDLIMVDIGSTVDGYGSDMTRMIAVGEVDEEKQRIFDIVLRAQSAGMAAVKAGAVCCDVDAAARDVIEAAGYGSFYPHGLGHPVGSGGREGPRFSPKDASRLPADTVMTVEPGIYLPGKFGIRMENMLLVKESSVENLTGVERKLFVV